MMSESNVRDQLTDTRPDGHYLVEDAEHAVDQARAYLEGKYLDGQCMVDLAGMDGLLAEFEQRLMGLLLARVQDKQEKAA